MTYQPFLIAPFKTGIDTDQEPWLLPQDAFTDIENGHIHHGYIEKRSGYQFLGQMVYGRDITAATNGTPAVFTVSSATGLADDQVVTLHYLTGGTWGNLNGQKYTITGLAGATFSLVDSSGTVIDGAALGVYTASSGRLGTLQTERMMGVFRFISASNTRQLLISDTKRVAIYNPAFDLFEPLDLFDSTSTLRPNSDVWASTTLDYIWSTNWQAASFANRVYFTNGKEYTGAVPGTDGIVFYDGQNARVDQFQPSLGGAEILYGCKLVFSIRNRLVCLHTFEYNGASTITYPQRARWSAADDFSNFTAVAGGGNAKDAATGDQIISAQLLEDQIIVNFTNSVWSLVPTSNPSTVFRWVKINNFRSCDAKMGTMPFDKNVIAVGNRGITATNGSETTRIDLRIEDFVDDEINQDQFGKVFAQRDYNNRRSWLLYPRRESTDCDAALIFDEESGAYSKYVFSREVSDSIVDFNVLGYGSVNKDYAAQDFISANDLDLSAEDFNEETALSFFWSQNAEWFLGGDRNGSVYILEQGTQDLTEGIDFSLEGAGWNPYKEQGIEVQFGYIDIYADSHQLSKLEIEFYKNDNEVPYASQGFDVLPNLNVKSSVTDIIPNDDPTTGFVVYSNTHGVAAGEDFYIYGAEDASFYNDQLWLADSVTANTISVAKDITSFGATITNITQANPGVVTAVNHEFQNGDDIYITDVSGMIEVNQVPFTIANVTADTFELLGVNTSGFTAYTSGGYAFIHYISGGQIVERKFYRTKVWKRAYAGGIGYQHRIKITSDGKNRPIRISAFKPWFRPVGKRILG